MPVDCVIENCKDLTTNAGTMFLNQPKSTVFWLIICVLGSCFQVYQVADQYFRYDINTNVRLEIRKMLNPPTLVFCTELSTAMKWHTFPESVLTKLLYDLPGGADMLNSDYNITTIKQFVSQADFLVRLQLISNLFKYFTTQEVFDNMTIYYRDFFHLEGEQNYKTITIHYHPVENHYVMRQFDTFFEVTEFIRDTRKCFSLDLKPEFADKIEYNKLRRQAVSQLLLTSLAIDGDIAGSISEVFSIMGPRHHVIRGGYSSVIATPTTQGTVAGIAYDEIEEHLLPPPFNTSCRRYADSSIEGRSFPIKSQDDCYETCVRHNSEMTLGMLIPGLSIFANETGQVLSYFDLFNNTPLLDKNGNNIRSQNYSSQVDKLCETTCSQRDCFVLTFIPKKIITLIREFDDNHFRINIHVRTPSILHAVCLQQYSQTQFITDILATLGFWLGFSAFNSVLFLRRLANLLLSKSNRTRTTSRKLRLRERVSQLVQFYRRRRIKQTKVHVLRVVKKEPSIELL